MKNFPFKIKKINLRITLYFSLLLIMIGLSITIINIKIYSDELSSQIDNVVYQKLSLISGKINTKIDEIKAIHTAMINDNSINIAFQNVVNEPNNNNIRILAFLLDNHPSIGANNQSVIAIGLNGEILNPINTLPAFQNLTKDNFYFKNMQKNNLYYCFSAPNTFSLENTSNNIPKGNNITMFAQYYNYESAKLLGYLAINFRKSLLFENIEPMTSETFSAIYIVDENETLIHQIGELDYNEYKKAKYVDKDIIKLNNTTYSVLTSSFPSYHKWKIISLFDRNIIKLQTNRLNFFIYLTLTIALIIMLFFSLIISQNITNPIKQVVHSMKEFELGKWPEPLETKNEDEIKDLINGYNSMLTNIIKLTDDIIARHQENKMIELNLIKTQIGLLEAQINPHFIHNTLNSMNYLALEKGNYELSEIIESFNKLLRTSMAINISFVTVSQEIQNIKDYAKIQKIRFENIFEIDYVVDEEALIALIPKLILQPIVENSIIHGILPKNEIGHIKITVKKDEEYLLIQVSDDGLGMSEERINEVMKKGKNKYVSKHIGIQNVIDRISLYYGENIYFNITSKQNEGTTVAFKIPYED